MQSHRNRKIFQNNETVKGGCIPSKAKFKAHNRHKVTTSSPGQALGMRLVVRSINVVLHRDPRK